MSQTRISNQGGGISPELYFAGVRQMETNFFSDNWTPIQLENATEDLVVRLAGKQKPLPNELSSKSVHLAPDLLPVKQVEEKGLDKPEKPLPGGLYWLLPGLKK